MTDTKPRPNSFTLDTRPNPGLRRNMQFRTICTCSLPSGITAWQESANWARIDGTAHYKRNHAGEPR